MTRRNRVDPFGDLHAVAERGMFTGNRGCLVDDDRRLVRHHQGNLWISCVTKFRGWRQPLDAPHRWTPLFFLDDAVALAAGHRPCGTCRAEAYATYRNAVSRAFTRRWLATDLNRQLAAERLHPGRGLERTGDRRRWDAEFATLPAGAVVLLDDHPHLVVGGAARPFGFAGWGPSRPAIDDRQPVSVLTPPLSVAALVQGYTPEFHPTAFARL